MTAEIALDTQSEGLPPEDVCIDCGGPNDDGEGWDGRCGNCADRAEEEAFNMDEDDECLV